MIMKTIFSKILIFTTLVVLCTSCNYNDEVDSGSTKLEIRLNSVSAPFDAVNIDIEGIFVNSSDDINTGWRRLDLIRPGVYNLLDYQNGLDALLTEQDFPSGNINHVRLVLASRNTVVKDGVTYPLDISLVILDANNELTPGGSLKLWLDFDILRSIVKTANGTYQLAPAVRIYNDNTSGVIEGNVANLPAQTAVWAVLEKDSILVSPNTNGYFRLSGLQESSSWKIIYDITDNDNNHQNIEIENVMVNRGQTTSLGIMNLPK